jgi:hypothetical protein
MPVSSYETSSIFGKTLSAITYSDIVQFCEKQIKESIYLDYKKDFSSPENIAKTIAAFANTLGGWLIIGVEDNGDDLPSLPSTGIDFTPQIELRVIDIIVGSIVPAVIPHIHVCTPNEQNKTFVILYIPESSSAPHWLINKNKLCVRLSSRSRSTSWERLASSEEWEYLRNKRELAVNWRKEQKELLNDLYEENFYQSRREYEERLRLEEEERQAGSIIPSLSPFLPTNFAQPLEEPRYDSNLSIEIAPTYPSQPFSTVQESVDFLQELSFQDVYSVDRFPFFTHLRKKFQYGGYIYNSLEENEQIYFVSLNTYGFISFKERVLKNDGSRQPQYYVEFDRLLVKFAQCLLFARNLYEKQNYYGEVSLELVLRGKSWMYLVPFRQANSRSLPQTPLEQMNYSLRFNATDLKDNSRHKEFLLEYAQTIANFFNWEHYTPGHVETIIQHFHLYEQSTT